MTISLLPKDASTNNPKKGLEILAKGIKLRDTKRPRNYLKAYSQKVHQEIVQELNQAQDLVTIIKTYFEEKNEDNIHYKIFI